LAKNKKETKVGTALVSGEIRTQVEDEQGTKRKLCDDEDTHSQGEECIIPLAPPYRSNEHITDNVRDGNYDGGKLKNYL
jgi:hypothetical protein